MNKVDIDIRNCYGIGEFNTSIEFSPKNRLCVIYAPNGTMKTSFALTVNDLIHDTEPKDRIFYERPSSAKVMIDGSPICDDNCYVFNNSKTDGNESISKFLANKELKDKYEEIIKTIEVSWNTIKKKISFISRSSDCEDEIKRAFATTPKQSIFECVHDIFRLYVDGKDKHYPLFTFKYNDVFDKDGKVKKFVEENKDAIDDYFSQYGELMDKSSIFTGGEYSFGTYQLNNLIKSVDDDKFFKASHKIEFRDGTIIDTKSEFKKYVDKSIKEILNNKELKKAFELIDKKLQGNIGLRAFKDTIQQDNNLLALLADYEHFRKVTLLGYLENCYEELESYALLYESKREELRKIIVEANKSVETWRQVIELFNTRFYVPFTVKIENQSEMILEEKTPVLRFDYSDSYSDHKAESQSELLECLSLGEKRAFYLLQNLFEIEARRAEGKDTLLIMDDIADSFDYKNKYAILEYISDICKDDLFNVLLLTHNFDFYRTVVSRLRPQKPYFTYRDDDRKVTLHEGIYNSDIIRRRFIEAIEDKRAFIGLIPFVRNLIEYSKGNSSREYLTLTHCLHIKQETSKIKMSDIMDTYKQNLYGAKTKSITFGEKLYLEELFNEANNVLQDSNEVDVGNKIILSIAIRLKAEQYMLKLFSGKYQEEYDNKKNQTIQLIKVLKKYYINTHGSQCKIMDRVLMLTSENIHFNNFMFEPIVDISSLHLKDLYRQVLNL